jgi:hypothetical protein
MTNLVKNVGDARLSYTLGSARDDDEVGHGKTSWQGLHTHHYINLHQNSRSAAFFGPPRN